ncbi:Asp-tRNA(Asn)/Glu-tRNA(Gln) amidotransferase subunit GatB [Candidatus Daviesbacteria bacterium]|nr:Asp-tRNA(Asn)/Glu-tRNA(Gln) amidotransferase subunit GatB [Candidatus Daviesbacteria bacterium]
MRQLYEPVIGIEVHVELNTASKMFCRCSTKYFGEEPNTHTCPVCLGFPGALPVINREAINKCIQIGLALNCNINPVNYFERKNYFYPDLPKGYQISQLVLPVAVGGWLEVEDEQGEETKVRINRAHQEEDTAKLTHRGTYTLIDFNRSGVPLVEIVTEPDFNSSFQVRDYAKKLQQIFRYLGVSDADMEKGDMRLEANVSVRKIQNSEFRIQNERKELPPYRVELKNINSFRFMVAAIEYEIKRQIEALEKGEKLTQETRGWSEAKKETYLQRSKEEAHDYRYFPEPDLPQLKIDEGQLTTLKNKMPELPQRKIEIYTTQLGVKEQDARILAGSKELAEFFETALEHGQKHGVSTQEVVNYIVNIKPDIEIVLPTQVVEEIKGKKVGKIDDEKELEKLAKMAIEQNPQAVEAYRKGKVTAVQSLVGTMMKLSGGKAVADKAAQLLRTLLK